MDNDTAEAEKPQISGALARVPIEITVAIGRARPKLGDLMNMGENAILPLDTRIEDPVELYVGDRLIARGQLEELEGEREGQLAVRLTDVPDLPTDL